LNSEEYRNGVDFSRKDAGTGSCDDGKRFAAAANERESEFQRLKIGRKSPLLRGRPIPVGDLELY
jgi:hypothetical protein